MFSRRAAFRGGRPERPRGRGVLPAILIVALCACGGRHGNRVLPDDGATDLSPMDGSSGSDGGDGGWMGEPADAGCGCDDPSPDGDPGDGTDAGGGEADAGGDGGIGGDGSGELRGPVDPGGRVGAGALAVDAESKAIAPPCIHGIVVDETGRRVAGAIVSGSPADGGEQGTATTGRAGHYCMKTGRALLDVTVIAITPAGRQVERRIDAAQRAVRDVHGCTEVPTVVAR